MSSHGEHNVDLHPRSAWRAFVAGCIAIALLLLGLVVHAHAEAPLTIAATPGPMAAVLHPIRR